LITGGSKRPAAKLTTNIVRMLASKLRPARRNTTTMTTSIVGTRTGGQTDATASAKAMALDSAIEKRGLRSCIRNTIDIPFLHRVEAVEGTARTKRCLSRPLCRRLRIRAHRTTKYPANLPPRLAVNYFYMLYDGVREAKGFQILVRESQQHALRRDGFALSGGPAGLGPGDSSRVFVRYARGAAASPCRGRAIARRLLDSNHASLY
jgi:hypothetical protein